MAKTAKITIARFYPDSSVVENITARLLSGVEDREKWEAKNKKRPAVLTELLTAILGGMPDEQRSVVGRLHAQFSRVAGCACGCSPGWLIVVDCSPEHKEMFKLKWKSIKTSYYEYADGRVEKRVERGPRGRYECEEIVIPPRTETKEAIRGCEEEA